MANIQVILLIMTATALAGAASPSSQPSTTLPVTFQLDATAEPQNQIDQIVFARLKQLRIKPAAPCSDAVFLRRVFLDVLGIIPTAQETRQFLADKDPAKRSALIDRLLKRDEFADYWAMKWDDLLRVKAEFPINLWPNASQSYHHWIHSCLQQGMPMDRFAREMLTASGSNFRVPAVNFYRAVPNKDPKTIAMAVALTFMGVRADKWPADRLDGLAAFFAQLGYKSTGEWKEEIVFFDPAKAAAAATQPATRPAFPDGSDAKIKNGQDPRQALADWLLAPDNQYFSRNLANRAWCWLMGRGIIHEPDDIRPDNPPANPQLLACLQGELVAGHYDIKQLFRLILNSQTYQLSCIPADKPTALPNSASGAEMQFAFYPVRRLEAEVLIDAICQITDSVEHYSTMAPEPYTFLPDGTHAIAIPDGSITSAFLDMFGRPSRDTGMETERNNRPDADQRLHLLNSSHIRNKIENAPFLTSLPVGKGVTAQAIAEIYLTILSRYPTGQETQAAIQYANNQATTPRAAIFDVAWALINSAEFCHRH